MTHLVLIYTDIVYQYIYIHIYNEQIPDVSLKLVRCQLISKSRECIVSALCIFSIVVVILLLEWYVGMLEITPGISRRGTGLFIDLRNVMKERH